MDPIYNDEQICKLCKNPFKEHLKKGETSLEDTTRGKTINIRNAANWCYKDIWERGTKPKEYEWAFNPMDNLSLIEYLAEVKGIIKKKSTRKGITNKNKKNKD